MNYEHLQRLKKKKKAEIYLWTGTGVGKSTSAFGAALRSVGHNHRVVIIQFMKGWKNIGEYKIREKLSPYYEIHQFGGVGWINLKNPAQKDSNLAKQGLEFARKKIRENPPDLLILDEINLASAAGLLKVDDVLNFLVEIPGRTAVYLTGRYAPEEFIELSDFVNVVYRIKEPAKFKFNKEGIDY
ncbi:MAG TPA: cob(I)yrinic acid a,c-diamide adenosyltransferase [Candidatus Nanoarchaeia archaeon]|nr:cob(I)yrinic acid a,c-diamide adenosyltransferase [Candidatus Nanoarchaeia archaeon]